MSKYIKLFLLLVLVSTQSIFAGRYYDAVTGRWLTVDPKANKYPEYSPYNYCSNNPLRNIDPNGKELTDFINKDCSVNHINDGSNAVFKEEGSGTGDHYQFVGFDPTQQSTGAINFTTLIQEGQNLNMSNPSLQPNSNTYCNFATQNIMNSIESTGYIKGASISGMANDMQFKLSSSSYYQPVDYKTASQNAQNGGLSIYSTTADPHGHIGTFSVGSNLSKGETANIGRNNGFMPLFNTTGEKGGGVYSPQNENVKFFKFNFEGGN